VKNSHDSLPLVGLDGGNPLAFLAALGEGVDPATAPVDVLIDALSATDPFLGGGVYMDRCSIWRT